MLHVNVNCSDYERSRTFYERLGFRVLWEVPETNTPEVAAAVGMPPYRVRGALLALRGAAGPTTLIDLLEWRHPRDASPPYPHLYHLGLARIALATSDLDADVVELEAAGVALLSAPARLPGPGGGGSRFVCFKDPDGTVLELVELEAAQRGTPPSR
jgi:catechol 2,3-dioxygenase-like lactoylglutathione lyase family enzyme